ncbi:MAG: formate--tetrahydrofolate ligase [Deltaproteobacteria bacterium]|nr:formate--tetrahydrofolate ligase [Deltaproteobacteria bacterium]
MRPILDVAGDLGLRGVAQPWGPGRAKIPPRVGEAARGRLILVSGMSPTPAGEGKTTMTIGLAQGLRRLGQEAVPVLRQPSQGPVFGKKGGGTGGGRATVEPSVSINLHLTGDFHAVAAAHNLLAAMVDNAARRGPLPAGAVPTWRRVVDVNDRALRRVTVGLDGAPRDTAFDITAASEVMAVLALARDFDDLQARLGRMVVATGGVTAAGVGAVGAMAALLQEAWWPNLVQTQEGGPALVHAGPFANIAHGTCSRVAMRMAVAHADYALVEAGFGFDLGGEKFLDIVCRDAPELWPSALVLVVTERAVALHGVENLQRHLLGARRFGLPTLVVVNAHPGDPATGAIDEACRAMDVPVSRCAAFARGGEGAIDAARALLSLPPSPGPRYLYPLDRTVEEKLAVLAESYGASGVDIAPGAMEALGPVGDWPVCMAKTPLSFTADPKRPGAPSGFRLPVRELRASHGAGFVVALCGEITTMPALPAEPAALRVRVGPDGVVSGVG